MVKFFQCVSIALVVLLATCCASPARLEKLKPSKSKFLARQEVVEDVASQTPYPPAGIKPAIPFNLPTDEKLVAPVNYYLPPVVEAPAKFYSPPAEEEKPAQVYGPPALTYGAPEQSTKDDVEQVAKDVPEKEEEQSVELQPEEVQAEEEQPSEDGPQEERKEEAENETQQDASPLEEVTVEQIAKNTLPQRLVLVKSNARQAAKLRSGKLQVLPNGNAPLKQHGVVAQPIYLVDGPLYSFNGQLYRI